MGLLFLRAHWWCMIDGPLHATHCSLSALTVPSANHSVSPQLAGTKRYLLYSNCFSAKGSRRGSWEVKGGKKKKCVLWSENKKEKPNTLILVKKVCTWQLKKKIVIITGHCIIDRWKFRFYSDQLLLSFSMLDSRFLTITHASQITHPSLIRTICQSGCFLHLPQPLFYFHLYYLQSLKQPQ